MITLKEFAVTIENVIASAFDIWDYESSLISRAFNSNDG